MTDTQKRYTDNELIALLRVLASDLNKRPTQREILKDSRMPTHHTYIKRFGSMKEAMVLADLDTLEDRSYTNYCPVSGRRPPNAWRCISSSVTARAAVV